MSCLFLIFCIFRAPNFHSDNFCLKEAAGLIALLLKFCFVRYSDVDTDFFCSVLLFFFAPGASKAGTAIFHVIAFPLIFLVLLNQFVFELFFLSCHF